MGLADFGAGWKIAKRFVSAGFASGGVWALPSLVDKKWPPKVSEKFLRQKTVQTFFLSHVLDHFWRTGFRGGFSCGAERVFGPLKRAENATFRPLGAVQNPHFAVVLPAVPCVFGLEFPLSLRFHKVSVGNLATRGVLPAVPCVVAPKFPLWLRFRGV